MNERTFADIRRHIIVAGLLFVLAVMALGMIGCDSSSDDQSQASTQGTVAATFAEMDLPTAIANADAIVLGTVTTESDPQRGVSVDSAMRQRLRTQGRTDDDIDALAEEFADWVYTSSVIEIERALKGDVTTGTVEVRVVGGEVDGYRFDAQGFPRLALGERQLIFLGMTWDGAYEPLAVYEIDGEEMASTSDQGRSDNMPLDELISAIEAHRDDPYPASPE